MPFGVLCLKDIVAYIEGKKKMPSWGPEEGEDETSPPHSRGSPNKGGQHQKREPHPCLLGGPKEEVDCESLTLSCNCLFFFAVMRVTGLHNLPQKKLH